MAVASAHGQIAVKNQGYVPFSEEPINYRSENLTDPVALLQKRIDRGEVKLEYEPKHGYLKSVLERLQIPRRLSDAGFLEDKLPIRAEDLA